MFKNRKFGGATLEYILVSTFATILTVAALTYLAGVFRERLDMLSNKLGIEIEFEELDFFDKNAH